MTQDPPYGDCCSTCKALLEPSTILQKLSSKNL
jgi:hypothetical protein